VEKTDDATDFSKRAGTLPPPKAGTRVNVKFPSDDQRGTPKVDMSGRTLQVLRWSPEGEVPLAPDLSVTFSQPMVTVTSQEEAARVVPVELSPQVNGKWRWLGTKTLMFDTVQRFPMATKFTARIPGGTTSATGQKLGKDFSWTFTTPPPKVETMYPNGSTTRRDTLFFISFDQEINPEAVLRSIAVTAGGRRMMLRLATEAEIAADSSVAYYAKQAQPKRWLAFRAVKNDGSVSDALPAASTISVSVEKGTPSAEGPLTTQQAQSFSFQTFGPFNFNGGYCGWRQNRQCTPHTHLVMEFNNTIDAAKFSKEQVKIEPAVENLNIFPSGNAIYINGYKKGNTTYKITVDKSLTDSFGQLLGQDAVATIKVGPAESSFYAQGGFMNVLDPAVRSFSVYSVNHTSAKLTVRRVRPEDWGTYQQYVQQINYDQGKRVDMPGRVVVQRTLTIDAKPDEMVETRIDLTPFLDGGLGNLIIEVEPVKKRDQYDRTRVLSWLQATQIGLDAFVDNKILVGLATDLRTGRPLEGVELSVYPNGSGAAVSEKPPDESGGLLADAWNWITSGFGDSGPNAVESVEPDGTTVETESIPEQQSTRTAANGVARLDLPATPAQGTQNMLIARRGGDVAFLPESADSYWQSSGSWYKTVPGDSLRWHVFDDRRMYKPKEEVAVKGYIRKVTGGIFGDVESLDGGAGPINWVVMDPQNNEIAKGTTQLNAFGAFDLKFTLPDNANLGSARVNLLTNAPLGGGSHTHEFQIQEFRRPEFEVTSKVETEAPHFVGASATLAVEAKYYAGGGLANADVNWSVAATPTNYSPPNHGDFTFGTWTPWWIYRGDESYNRTSQTFKGKTDAGGKHRLKIDFESVNPPRPYSVTASSSVQDVNRQTWSSSTSLLVHPSSLYVGIKTPRTFVQKGEKIDVETIVTDIDGKLVPGREVSVKAVLTDWRFDKGSWSEQVVDEQACTVTSTATAQKCSFTAKQGGRYKISANVMDDRERFNESEITVWVPGGKTPPNRSVEQGTVEIIPSKKEFAPGDTAELLVVSPFTPAEGVLTLRRDGIVKTERFSIKDSSTTLRIPIDEKYLPNIYAQVDVVGADARVNDKGEIEEKLPKRPAFASGNINLSVSTASRRLTVTADPADKTLIPGGETKVNVQVKDHRGEPVANSEVAVVVVDESVLALSRYIIGDPADTFYTARGAGTRDYHSRAEVLLANPEDAKNAPPPPPPAPGVVAESAAVYVDGFAGGAAQKTAAPRSARTTVPSGITMANVGRDEGPAIAVRQNFNALAKFSPSVRTDGNGRAVVDLKLPDNLTRYRITAVSVDTGKRFGKTESDITAKQPLMVRPSAPRFMNFGDKAELPVVLQNQTDKDMTVDVAIRATNANLGTDGNFSDTAGKRVLVKANDRVEVRFPGSTVRAGTARFQFAATSGSFSDAAEIELPIWTPATTEAFATYGTTDQNGAIVQPVQAPGDVYPEFGGLDVTTSSTQLQELTDAFLYLTNYPYGCSEQIASRMISIAAMRDVLSAFKAKEMPTKEQLDAYYKRDLEILGSRQRDDGSFGLWKKERDRYEYPFLTVHVAHALGLAKAKGYKVPDEMLNRTKPYLKNVESHFDQWHKNSPEVRWTISAYALYVRGMIGDRDAAKAKKLLAEATIEKMPFEALGWVLSVLADDAGSKTEVAAIMRHLLNRTTETAAAANFVTDYHDGAWLIMASNRRADGVLLESMIRVRGDSGRGSAAADAALTEAANDLIPKLVRGLLDHRTKGAWSNTQENVFILLALDKYFNAFEKVTPDFVTRVWLGNAYAGEQAFRGRSAVSNDLNIPMSYLMEQGGAANLIFDKQGAGRLYYRIGMKYAPKNLKLEPADYGFTVLRTYEALDDAGDVRRNADGSWTIKSGARVRVRLSMIASSRRYHVALVDNLPAGLEILNPGLAVTEDIPADTGATGVLEVGSRSMGRNTYWWRQYWFEHQNFRDERAEAFASLLWEGVYNYSYVARATTPGQFVVPPAKAEEMYHPETFGRTATDMVRVE
jgi:uncharacterized protein YfaS (alpha-2-macroglobulin family)